MTAKGITLFDEEQKLGRHVFTVKRYLEDFSPRKPRSDCWVLTPVTQRAFAKSGMKCQESHDIHFKVLLIKRDSLKFPEQLEIDC